MGLFELKVALAMASVSYVFDPIGLKHDHVCGLCTPDQSFHGLSSERKPGASAVARPLSVPSE